MTSRRIKWLPVKYILKSEPATPGGEQCQRCAEGASRQPHALSGLICHTSSLMQEEVLPPTSPAGSCDSQDRTGSHLLIAHPNKLNGGAHRDSPWQPNKLRLDLLLTHGELSCKMAKDTWKPPATQSLAPRDPRDHTRSMQSVHATMAGGRRTSIALRAARPRLLQCQKYLRMTLTKIGSDTYWNFKHSH